MDHRPEHDQEHNGPARRARVAIFADRWSKGRDIWTGDPLPREAVAQKAMTERLSGHIRRKRGER